MNITLIVFLIYLTTCISYARGQENCGLSEEYLECGGCNKTCNDAPNNLTCARVCHPSGCYCKPGYLRLSEHDPICVEYAKCPRCAPNQEYLRCGTSCPDYCGKPANDNICSFRCAEGCYCKSGYIQKSKNSTACIKEITCSGRRCGKYKTYSRCGSSCPDYCGRTGNQICNGPCVGGCICKPGYVRKSKNSTQCVKESTCRERRCGRNEVYSSCGSFCPDYCGKPGGVRCIQGCKSDCFCRDGFIRQSANRKKCIPLNQCPKR